MSGFSSLKYKHVKHCSTHPKFLHSNSTSHRWAFGAIAELIDNAIDPDVNASQFCIDLKEFNNEPCLVLMDNGCGLTPERLHKMLSFGHSKKQLNPGDRSIGKHGNGFKSGTMRLGRDVLVLTKCAVSMTAGFLSQTFLAAVAAEDILIPLVTWDLRGNRVSPKHADIEESLQAICQYSIFPDEPSILAQLDAIPGTGTILIISNLRRHEGVLEMDYKSDPHDIRITSEITSSHYQQLRPNQPHSTDVPSDYSLRAYVSILYKVPRMQIFIRDNKVKTKRISGILSQKVLETYRPMGAAEPVKIEMGFNTENRNLYGMMLYHRNRLIKPYMRVGMQLEENERGMGVLGIVEADFLQPTHNKQDFDDTTAYRRLLKKLSDVLAEYWWEKKERAVTLSLPAPETPAKRPVEAVPGEDDVPDVVWVQCDNPSCLKWRILPEGTDPTTLPDSWFCEYHPDPRFRKHEEAEQEWDMSVHHEIVERRKERKREYDRERKEKEANKRRQRLEVIVNKEEQTMLQRQREALMKELEEQRAKDALIIEQERKNREEAVSRLQKELEEVQAKRDEIEEQHNSLLKRMESDAGKKSASKKSGDENHVQFSEHEMSQVGVSGSEDLSEERPVESNKNEEACSIQQPMQWKDAPEVSKKSDESTPNVNAQRYSQQQPESHFMGPRLTDASQAPYPSNQASYLSLQSNNTFQEEARRTYPEAVRSADDVRQTTSSQFTEHNEPNFSDRRAGHELNYQHGQDPPRVFQHQGAHFNVEESRSMGSNRLQALPSDMLDSSSSQVHDIRQRTVVHGVQNCVPEFTSRFQHSPQHNIKLQQPQQQQQQLPGSTLGPLSSFQNVNMSPTEGGSRSLFQDGSRSLVPRTESQHPVHYSLSGVAGSGNFPHDRIADCHPSSLSLCSDSMVVARPDSSITTEGLHRREAAAEGRLRMAVQTLLRLSEAPTEMDELLLSDLEVLTICEKAKAIVGMRWQAYEQEIAKLRAELTFTMATDKLHQPAGGAGGREFGQGFRIRGLAGDNWEVGPPGPGMLK